LRSSRLKRPKVSTKNSVQLKKLPIKETISKVSIDTVKTDETDATQPIKINPKYSIFNKFEVDPIKTWIGKQLKN
jgi:hypothetical protein